jgi:hypothetical protein
VAHRPDYEGLHAWAKDAVMRIEKEMFVQRKAVFTRDEIKEKLGIDLDDFFLVEIDRDYPLTLEFYYTRDRL